MCSKAQFPHHVDTTSVEPVLPPSGMAKSSTNVLSATSVSSPDQTCRSIPSYQRWLIRLEGLYKYKSLVLNQEKFLDVKVVLNQEKFPVTSVPGPS